MKWKGSRGRDGKEGNKRKGWNRRKVEEGMEGKGSRGRDGMKGK